MFISHHDNDLFQNYINQSKELSIKDCHLQDLDIQNNYRKNKQYMNHEHLDSHDYKKSNRKIKSTTIKNNIIKPQRRRKNRMSKSDKFKKANSRKVFVGGITCHTNQQVFRRIISQFGEIESIKYANSKSGYEKSYCFVIFKHQDSKKRLLAAENLWLGDRLLSVREILSGN